MSKQQLTIENLAPYLPYGVKVLVDNGNGKYTDIITGIGIIDDMIFLDETGDWYYNDENDFTAKLVLRPLSDLTKEIEHNGEKFIPWHKLEFGIDKDLDIEIIVGDSEYLYLSYIGLRNEMQKLFEWHFDVFGLIEKGLAININEVK